MSLHADKTLLYKGRSNRDLAIELANIIGLPPEFKDQATSSSQLYWNLTHRKLLADYIKAVPEADTSVGEGLFADRGFLLRSELIDIIEELLEPVNKDSKQDLEQEIADEAISFTFQSNVDDELDALADSQGLDDSVLADLLVSPPKFMELTTTLANSFTPEWRDRMIQVKKYKKMVVVAFTLE